jgi:transposase InsO family protein
MRQAGLRGLAALPRRTRTTDSRHTYPIAPNRLGRNFVADRPGQVWLDDLTYIPTGEGWLYLAAVLDLHTRKIVGWSMRKTLHTEIALEALTMAIVRQRPPPGLIHTPIVRVSRPAVSGRPNPNSDRPFSVAGAARCPGAV